MAKCQYKHGDYQCELNAEYIEYNRNHTEEERKLCYFHYLSMACNFIKYKGTFDKPYNINNDSDLIGVVNTKFPDFVKASVGFSDKLQKLLFENDDVVLKDIYLPAFGGFVSMLSPILDKSKKLFFPNDYIEINSIITLEILDMFDFYEFGVLMQKYEDTSFGEIVIDREALFYSSASSKAKKFHFTFSKIKFNNLFEIKGNIALHFGGCQFNDTSSLVCDRLTILDSIFAENKTYTIVVPFTNLYLSKSIGYSSYLFEKVRKIYFFDGYNSHLGELEKADAYKEFQKGYFHMVDLRNTIFHDSILNQAFDIDRYPDNLKKIDFANCKFNDGHKLYEKDVHPKRLEYSYRYLRKHYDEKGDYIEGNDFHYNYMEAKRKNTENITDKFILSLYGMINGYNTKPENTLRWMWWLFFICTMWITFFGNVGIKNVLNKDLEYTQLINISDYGIRFWHSVAYNLTNLIPILKSDRFIGIDGLSLSIGIFENIAGIILAALLLMALRNRFRRSKTPEEIKEN